MTTKVSGRMTRGATIYVGSVAELVSLPSLIDGAHYDVTGYHPASDVGGGVFYWDSSLAKSAHNGGTVIDPEKTFPSDWTITASVTAWFTADGVGSGCFVRKKDALVFLDSFGIISGSEVNAPSNKIAWNTAKVSVNLLLGSPGATYWLPPETFISAPGLDLDLLGATLKQVSGTHDNNWLLVEQSNGFKLRHGIIDGNRLGATGLTIDRSLLTVYWSEDVDIQDCVVKDSAAKGLSVTSSLSGTGTRRVRLKNITAYSCEEQCIIVESTGSPACEDISLSSVFIKDTSHAGIAINDGARRVTLTNCIADVNNATWDAISVRGAYDVTITNCVGRRGRNGCRIFIIDQPALDRGEDARNITLSSNIWTENQQGGLAIAGAENVSVSGDIAKNNGRSGGSHYGISVVQLSGVRRANHVTLSSVQSFDNQAVKTQGGGIIVGAADNVKVSVPVIYGNITSNRVEAISGTGMVNFEVVGDGKDGATHKFRSQTTGEIPASGQATVVVTFDTPFDIAPSWAGAQVLFGSSTPYLRVQKISGLNANQINVDVRNDTAIAATGTLYAEARCIT